MVVIMKEATEILRNFVIGDLVEGVEECVGRKNIKARDHYCERKSRES